MDYEDNLERLEGLGGELVEFGPLTSRHGPAGAKGLYLGGGYPELYARQLSRNRALRAEICAAARAGLPVLAECGGFLYLQEGLEDENGVFWPMAGVLSGRGKRASGTGRFGYISLTAEQDTPYLPRGETIAAHEFHRWDSGDNGTACRAQKRDSPLFDVFRSLSYSNFRAVDLSSTSFRDGTFCAPPPGGRGRGE